MKIIALVSVLFALATSQPHPRCASPRQWEGIAVVLDPKRGDFIDTIISYDFINQRLRYLATITIFNNSSKPTTEHAEEIFNYSEKIQYLIDLDTKTCQKIPLSGSLEPIEVPATAHFITEEWIGVEGLLGAGFQTELWAGPTPYGRYAGLWSEVGCIPIMDSYNISSAQTYSHVTFYNVTLGIRDPNVFTPPSYC